MTDIDVSAEAVMALLNGISEWPWMVYSEHHGEMGETHPAIGTARDGADWLLYVAEIHPDGEDTAAEQKQGQCDATFIALAPALVAALAADRDAARAEAARVRSVAARAVPYVSGGHMHWHGLLEHCARCQLRDELLALGPNWEAG